MTARSRSCTASPTSSPTPSSRRSGPGRRVRASRSSSPRRRTSTSWSAAASRATTCRTSRSSRSRASRWTSRARGKLADLRDVLDMDALEASVVPGILDAATDEEGAIFAAPMSISVKSLVWYPKQAFEAAGLRDPGEPGGAAGPDGPDQGRRNRAVVHRDRERTGHRLAGDRLAGGLRPPCRWHRGLRPVGQARDPVRRPDGQGGAGSRRGHLGPGGQRPRRPGGRSPATRSPPRATRCSRTRRGASCTGRPASSPCRGTSPTP